MRPTRNRITGEDSDLVLRRDALFPDVASPFREAKSEVDGGEADSSLSKARTLQHSARKLMVAAGDGFDGSRRSSRGR
ncbi:unnamed protein product [Linum trigynum]|uniref:Uncharacterized protein n=1 Tax=Linum trigynum TaxID=586398 RepID=A0AAV2DX23_9ROSI